MVQFIKNVFSSALGFLLALGVLGIISFIFLIGAAATASSSGTPSIKKNSILRIPLSGTLTEQSSDDPLSEMLGMGGGSLAINDLCRAIDKAKDLNEIKGIFLESYGSLAANPASLQEVRQHLLDFKKSGKFIVSYGDFYTQGGYYLCSTADKIAINPEGMLQWKGFGAQLTFYKELMEKVGVKMQVFKVGTFKSAVEPYINTSMSEPNRLQVTSYLGSIWNNILEGVSSSRNISIDSLQALADRYLLFSKSEDLLSSHLIDTLAYIDGTRDMLKRYAGTKEDGKLTFASIGDVLSAKDKKKNKSKNQIAVYYAEGEIVDEVPQGIGPATGSYIVGDKVVSDMDKLLKDKDVKAVVLRINSPGGSAFASEKMWHAIKQVDAKKPVIISQGGVAASGGYYMSAAGRYIFSEPTTITGSIGIFGMMPDASELLQKKLGLHYDYVKTNKRSDFTPGNYTRPMTEDEGALMQAYVERGYGLFLSRVSEGRGKTNEQVDSIGQGRVWTGEQALEIGLVDELGGLDEALAYAAKQAELGEDWKAINYPESEPWYMQFINKKKNSYYESRMRNSLGELYQPFVLMQTIKQQNPIQARLPYDIDIR
ncbi:MAG: signal peptide peptidase SppA [Bacteroidaceae bacterium]|nr:signal peptide peptidase SppA [Bacteroidaceae bacterium]